MSWINRDDLIEWLHTEEDEMLEIDDRREAHEASYIRKHVREMPGMDVKPVAHAHWIPYESETGEGSNTYKCSSCGEVQIIIDGTPKENGWNYCPHCGAKMDDQENGAEDD